MTDTSFTKNKLAPLHEVDKEEYRQRKIKEVRKRNGLATLGFCVMAGMITGIMLIIAENRLMILSMGLFYGGMFVIGVGTFVFFWISAEKNAKTMKFYTIYEGTALIISANPLMVQYFKVDGTKVIKQVDLQIRQAIPIGAFVEIVIENDKIVKLTKEGGELVSMGNGL